MCVSLNCAWEVALTGPEGSLCPLLAMEQESSSATRRKGEGGKWRLWLELFFFGKSVCVLSTPPKAVRSSAVRRLLPGGSAGVVYPTSAPSLILAAAIQRNGSSGESMVDFERI